MTTTAGSTAPAPPIIPEDGERLGLINPEDEVRVAGFEPDQRHWAYLAAVSRAKEPLTLSAIAEAIDVPKQTIFDWEHNPGFQNWIAIHRERVLRDLVFNGWTNVYNKMMSGSAAHARLFMQRFDKKFDRGKKGATEGDDGDEGGKISSSAVIQFFQVRSGASKEQIMKLMTRKARIVPIED